MLIVAVSDAVVTGSAALLGAVVGAVAGGIADYWLERRQEVHEARAGARLLQAELSAAASQLEAVGRECKWWVFYEMSLRAWDNYRGVLSAQLKREEWMTVSQSVVELRGLDSGMKSRMQTGVPGVATPAISGSLGVGDQTMKAAARMRSNATDAYNALCRLAETDTERNLLPGTP
jgi:hypothetical protein